MDHNDIKAIEEALPCSQRHAMPEIGGEQSTQPVHAIRPDTRHEHPVDAPGNDKNHYQPQDQRERQLQWAQ